MSPLLNYSTEISTQRSVSEIMALLARHGASNIAIDYAAGEPAALRFTLPTPLGLSTFRLPANSAAVYAVLQRQARQGQVRRRYVSPQQAGRIAWRILRDWLAAQLAILETEMVTLPQVLLPYMENDQGLTVWEAVEQYHQLPAPHAEGRRP